MDARGEVVCLYLHKQNMPLFPGRRAGDDDGGTDHDPVVRSGHV